MKHHPNQTVCLLLHTDDREMVRHLETDLQSTLPAFHNASRRSSLRVVPMSLDQVFDRTPLFRWWQEELQFSLSKWKTNHLSDAARLAFLWKYGGMYLDHGTRKHDVPIIKAGYIFVRTILVKKGTHSHVSTNAT